MQGIQAFRVACMWGEEVSKYAPFTSIDSRLEVINCTSHIKLSAEAVSVTNKNDDARWWRNQSRELAWNIASQIDAQQLGVWQEEKMDNKKGPEPICTRTSSNKFISRAPPCCFTLWYNGHQSRSTCLVGSGLLSMKPSLIGTEWQTVCFVSDVKSSTVIRPNASSTKSWLRFPTLDFTTSTWKGHAKQQNTDNKGSCEVKGMSLVWSLLTRVGRRFERRLLIVPFLIPCSHWWMV